MKNQVFKATVPMLKEAFGDDITKKVMEEAEKELQKLLLENPDEPKAVKTHTQGKIYPCIALYRGLLKAGIEKENAVHFLDVSMSRQAQKQAKAIQMLLKIPGLYKKMPAMFKFITLNTFGEKAGFQAKFYDCGKHRVKFDMTKCLYCDTCRKNNCAELVPCFCHTDDVTDGHMHEKLKWNRTKVMGEGADVCDFDLFVVEEKK